MGKYYFSGTGDPWDTGKGYLIHGSHIATLTTTYTGSNYGRNLNFHLLFYASSARSCTIYIDLEIGNTYVGQASFNISLSAATEKKQILTYNDFDSNYLDAALPKNQPITLTVSSNAPSGSSIAIRCYDANYSYLETTNSSFRKLTFNVDGNTTKFTAITSSSPGYDGINLEYTIPNSYKPAKSGYTFNGWLINGTTYQPGETVELSGGSNHTAYADWKPNEYTITLNPNGGSGQNIQLTKYHGTNLTMPFTEPSREGYTFEGWNTKSDGSGTTYTKGSNNFNIESSMTLYAKWTIIQIKVIYNGNGGSLENGNIVLEESVNYGDSVNLTSQNDKNFKKTGYNFAGWGTHLAATAPPSNIKEIKQETQLYAIWKLGSNIRIFTNGKWEIALPYIYKDAQWQLTISKVFNDGEWRQ